MSKRWMDDYLGLRRGTVLFVTVLFLLLSWLFSYIRALEYEFNGKIEKVIYSYPKHIPTITIKGVDYDLVYNNWDGMNQLIEEGDSAIKEKGETHFKLIKLIKRKVIIY